MQVVKASGGLFIGFGAGLSLASLAFALNLNSKLVF